MGRRKWTKQRILRTIRELNARGESLSTRNMAAIGYSGMVTTTYKPEFFAGWRAALEAAGVDPSVACQRRKKWTRQRILQTIRQLARQGEDLSHSAAKRNHQYLVVVASDPASFGSWRKAVTAAGLDYEAVCRHRRWSKERIVAEIRGMAARGESLSHEAAKQSNAPLVSAASSRRYFGSWAKAVEAAGFSYDKIRKIKSWDRQKILETILDLYRAGERLNNSSMRKRGYRGMMEAAARPANFGSWQAALMAAGVQVQRRKKPGAARTSA